MPTKKRVSFNYHQDFKCKISANYSGEVMELFEYDVVGVAESVNEHGNVPNVILTFILDRFGYPHVVSADGTIEV